MKSNITISEVMDKQETLEKVITDLLRNFQQETGFYVENIDLNYLGVKNIDTKGSTYLQKVYINTKIDR